MIDRRKFIATGTGLGLSSLLGQLAFAQMDPGGGTDAGQVLPGPFGYLGGNPGDLPGGPPGEGDDEKKDKNTTLQEGADNLQEFGDWAMTVGEGGVAIGGGIIVVTGETGVGAVVGAMVGGGGAGLFAGGAFASGVGMALGWIADDPPRPNYQVSASCGVPNMNALTGLQGLSAPYKDMVKSGLELFSSSASTLAALELWQGAHMANDAQWRIRHRASFVSSWNAMRQDLKAYAKASKTALKTFRTDLNAEENGLETLKSRVKTNRANLKSRVLSEMSALENLLSASCPNDSKLILQAAKKFNPPAKMASFKEIAGKLDRLEAVADRLPVYS